MIGRFVPVTAPGRAPSVHNELRALRSVRLWLVLAATVLVTGGCMATFSFISPLLADRAGISLELVPLVFVGFGVGSIIGTNLSGRFADRHPVATFVTTAIAGIALDSSVGSTGPATVGVAMVTLGLVPLIALAAARTTPSPAYHHAPV